MAQATVTVVILMMALVMVTGSVLMVVAAVVTNLGYLVLNPPWARSENVEGVVLALPLLYYSRRIRARYTLVVCMV